MSAVRCLVTGASGYVGGRLVPLLLAHGHQVRCLVRSAHQLRNVAWAGQVEIVEGEVTDRRSRVGAFDGTDIVYYLAHASGRADSRTPTEPRSRPASPAPSTSAVRTSWLIVPLRPLSPQLSAHWIALLRLADVDPVGSRPPLDRPSNRTSIASPGGSAPSGAPRIACQSIGQPLSDGKSSFGASWICPFGGAWMVTGVPKSLIRTVTLVVPRTTALPTQRPFGFSG
jgi:hypothetical protein